MRTNMPDVFSAGDVTSFPLTIRGDQRVNIGHWQMSQAHGKSLTRTKEHCLMLCGLVGVAVWIFRKKASFCYLGVTNEEQNAVGEPELMLGIDLIVFPSCLFDPRTSSCPEYATETNKN